MVVHRYRIPKRFTDLNVDGTVDHSALIDYLQEARTELLLAAAEPMRSMLGAGVLVTGHWVEFLAPANDRESTVAAEVWVDQVGAARFSLSYRFSDGDRPVLHARTFLVPYDLAAGKLRRLTDPERGQLESALADPVPLRTMGKVRPDALDGAAEVEIRARWGDLDAYGHVNNVKFFDYLAQARRELLGAGTADGRWQVGRQDLDYRLPIDFRRDPYRVRTALLDVDARRCELAADIVDPVDQRCFATSRAVLSLVDDTGRELPIGTDVQESLSKALLTQQPGRQTGA